jgi:NADH:ubiquinone oxidoreductase subunit K
MLGTVTAMNKHSLFSCWLPIEKDWLILNGLNIRLIRIGEYWAAIPGTMIFNF